jgi:hypothetical protein
MVTNPVRKRKFAGRAGRNRRLFPSRLKGVLQLGLSHVASL